MSAVRSERQRPSSTAIRRRGLQWWQRALFVGYVLVLALILPLICWGALAAPGHPHRVPHIVFLHPPPLPREEVPAPVESAAMPDNHHAGRHNTAPAPHKVEHPANEAGEERAVGRASLSLMLFSILTFMTLGAWVLAHIDQYDTLLLAAPPSARSIGLPVPLPPPRHARFSPALGT